MMVLLCCFFLLHSQSPGGLRMTYSAWPNLHDTPLTTMQETYVVAVPHDITTRQACPRQLRFNTKGSYFLATKHRKQELREKTNIGKGRSFMSACTFPALLQAGDYRIRKNKLMVSTDALMEKLPARSCNALKMYVIDRFTQFVSTTTQTSITMLF